MPPAAAVQEPTITAIDPLPIADAKWLTLQRITYTDAAAHTRTWEAAVRKTTPTTPGAVDAVAIGNILLAAGGAAPPQTLLVVQYRPPLDAYSVEWPAGLVDAGEDPEAAARREFREETGYDVARVLSVSPRQAADPGMSNASMRLVMVEVDLPPAGEAGSAGAAAMPEQRLDDEERIERVVVPLAELYERLVAYSERERYVVAAKLMHFAQGMDFMKRQPYF